MATLTPRPPALVAFDLDDTLAPSKSPLPPAVATALLKLLAQVPVCIISGGDTPQFTTQVLEHLPVGAPELARLHLMPTCGTKYFRFDAGQWHQVYSHELTATEAEQAQAALREEAARLGLWEDQPWGDIIENRGSQITFSALGQQAPLEAKRSWDPDGSKKAALRAAVAARLPDLEVRSGGSTSVDITMRGVDKAYGMRKLVEMTGIAADQMLFVGDRLDEGGNDRPVLDAGWPCQAVAGWEETAALVENLVAELVVNG